MATKTKSILPVLIASTVEPADLKGINSTGIPERLPISLAISILTPFGF
jgi:hypothetical protein